MVFLDRKQKTIYVRIVMVISIALFLLPMDKLLNFKVLDVVPIKVITAILLTIALSIYWKKSG